MKKFLIGLLLVSGSAMADNFIAEYTTSESADKTTTGQGWFFKGTRNIAKNLDADVSFQTSQSDQTHKVDSKVEAGLVTKFDLFGPVRGYSRLHYGEKFSSTGNYNYWGIEPGIQMPLGYGFSTKIGYRYRAATNSVADTTRTLRAGISYDLTKNDAIGVRYDRMRGDKEVNYWNFNYVRSF